MRIAICEDSPQEGIQLKAYINRYDADLQADLFQSREALLDGLQKKAYDLIFMDIDLDGQNGYELAVEIKERDESQLIVFTTQHVEYAIRGYGIAERYLQKPISYEEFRAAMQAVIRILTPSRVLLKSQSRSIMINPDKTMYFESFGHNVEFHQKDGEVILFPISVREVMEALPKEGFCQIHRCYGINMDYIDQLLNRNLVIMTDGRQMTVSRAKQGELEKRLLDHLKGKIQG